MGKDPASCQKACSSLALSWRLSQKCLVPRRGVSDASGEVISTFVREMLYRVSGGRLCIDCCVDYDWLRR